MRVFSLLNSNNARYQQLEEQHAIVPIKAEEADDYVSYVRMRDSGSVSPNADPSAKRAALICSACSLFLSSSPRRFVIVPRTSSIL